MITKYLKPNFIHYVVYWYAWFLVYRPNKESMIWALVLKLQLKTLCKLRARILYNRNIYKKHIILWLCALRPKKWASVQIQICIWGRSTWTIGPHFNMHLCGRELFLVQISPVITAEGSQYALEYSMDKSQKISPLV